MPLKWLSFSKRLSGSVIRGEAVCQHSYLHTLIRLIVMIRPKALAQKWQQRYSGRQLKVGRDSYLRMIDGLLYGEDPRQGYVERNTFYHPELKFQYPIPNGWRTVNTPSQVQMAPEDGNAVMVFSLSTKNNLTQAEQAYMETHQFDVTSRNNRQVNGLNARVVQGRQIDEQNQQAINILLYFIEHGGRVYQLLGMAYQQQYANYESNFLRTMNGFDRLSDASKINVQPERIKIVEAPRTTNLRSVLSSNGIPGSRLEEFSILNGMELNSQVQKGTLIKVVDKAGN